MGAVRQPLCARPTSRGTLVVTLSIGCEIVGYEPIRQLTDAFVSPKIAGSIPSNRALVRSTSLCGLSSGAYAVLRRPHNPRTCAMEAIPPASKCASATASTSSIAVPDSGCWARNCKANLATGPFPPTSSFHTFIGTTFRACRSSVLCIQTRRTVFSSSVPRAPAISSKSWPIRWPPRTSPSDWIR